VRNYSNHFKEDFLMLDERDIEKRLISEVKKIKGLVWKFVSPGTRGVPDRIVILPKGQVIFIELKKPGEKPGPLQDYRHRQLTERGQLVYVIDSLGGVDRFIQSVKRGDA
jgi:hypothetical protein